MSSPSRKLDSFSALSFDCFGTLVDWEGGIYDALKPLHSRLDSSHPLKNERIQLLKLYKLHEGRIQVRNPTQNYHQILSEVYVELAKELDLHDQINPEEKTNFAKSISTWPTFPDTLAALKTLKKHYKLIILSNVDKDSFDKTLSGPLAEIQFDAVYVAEEIGSYKPDLRNFEYLIQHCGSDLNVKQGEILHTAYALIHDHVPASATGLATCWIERKPNAMGGDFVDVEGDLALDFRFQTLGDMADEVEKAFA